MQTFLPYPDYYQSAMTLDRSRLGNQCYKEGKILLGGGWPHHPASKMWRGYEHHLARYCLACAHAMLRRGWHRPGIAEKWSQFFAQKVAELPYCASPPWLGDDRLHSSHRQALLYKNPAWYAQFGWREQPIIPGPKGKLPYFWPSEPEEYQ